MNLADLQRIAALEDDIEPCRHCGRVMLAGMCCSGMAKDCELERLREHGFHPDQIKERQAAARERRIQRRADKRNAKT